MADKTIPVWLHQGSGQKIQIGVAGEVDPVTNAQPVDIWDEFKDYKIKNYTIGDSEAPLETEKPKTREEVRKSQGGKS